MFINVDGTISFEVILLRSNTSMEIFELDQIQIESTKYKPIVAFFFVELVWCLIDDNRRVCSKNTGR